MNVSRDPASLLSRMGSVVLVTGAAGGIGSTVVRMFRNAGARVLCADLPGKDTGEEIELVPCDLTDPDAVGELAAWVEEAAGGLDSLIHCAGIVRDAVLWKMAPADWSKVLAVNLDSAFYLLRALAPLLRKSESGSVILVSSINGERGKFGQANYAASKAGLIALAKTAAKELGRNGVRVNAIAPGFIRTRMTAGLPPEIEKRAQDETVLGRVGRPEDVAGAALFLCSDLAAHVTGQVLRVDGGQCTA